MMNILCLKKYLKYVKGIQYINHVHGQAHALTPSIYIYKYYTNIFFT